MGGWGFPWRGAKSPLAVPVGSLRNEIQLQTKGAGQDPVTKKPEETWTTVLTTKAMIQTLAVKEVYQTAQFTGQVTHRVTVRWPGASITLQGGMRVVFGARTFVVQGVENPQERNRIVHLLCQELDGVQ